VLGRGREEEILSSFSGIQRNPSELTEEKARAPESALVRIATGGCGLFSQAEGRVRAGSYRPVRYSKRERR